MNNPKIPKERSLVMGAIRRVFSRSELRRAALEVARVEHSDPKRKRVKKWYKCRECGRPEAAWKMQVDHMFPVVPINLTLEGMSWDTVVDRTWCGKENLQVLCVPCHKAKSKQEQKARRTLKLT